MNLPPLDHPLAYFITFTCYGTRLHGDADGTVDRNHNVFGSPYLPRNRFRMEAESIRMKQAAYELDEPRRKIVLTVIIDVCRHRGWTLLAAQVRSNHVHVVVQALDKAEKVLNDWRRYASRHLNLAKLDLPGRIRWSRHGSTRYLWTDKDVKDAVQYVTDEQGEPMEVYVQS